ncbi:hypothetical protein EIP86_005623 [Pleurotus ostreatoroseus]|nr:hypothetical protein EIP86_005623 [Pleurotus ostreatoroseus]
MLSLHLHHELQDVLDRYEHNAQDSIENRSRKRRCDLLEGELERILESTRVKSEEEQNRKKLEELNRLHKQAIDGKHREKAAHASSESSERGKDREKTERAQPQDPKVQKDGETRKQGAGENKQRGKQDEGESISAASSVPSQKIQFYDNYCSRWELIETSEDLLSFADIPWPTLNLSCEINEDAIREFYSASFHGHSVRQMIKTELLRWHPDKFRSKYLRRVRCGDREKVEEMGASVAKFLSGFLGEISGR